MSYGLGLGIIDLELGLGVPVISIIIIPMVIVATYGAILTVSVVWLLFVMLYFCPCLCYVFGFWYKLRLLA